MGIGRVRAHEPPGAHPGAPDPELATDLSIDTTVTTRCTAGVQYVSVRVVNAEQVPLDVVVRTPSGTKTFVGVAPDRSASQTFRVRDAVDGTGLVETEATGADGASTVDETPSSRLPAGSPRTPSRRPSPGGATAPPEETFMSRYAYVPDAENNAVQSVIDELTSP
ncbi:hypothetical protein NKG05_09760 [Oerskovia sp. M15]